MAHTKKVKSAGRFRVKSGITIRERIKAVEQKQRKKQICPYCSKKGLKRISKGIWQCLKCKRKFAGHAYYINE